jgi:hypothetical protein
VDKNQRKCATPLSLPMTVAKNLDPRLNLDQPLFWLGKRKPAWQQKTSDCLNVAATKEAPGAKFGVASQI